MNEAAGTQGDRGRGDSDRGGLTKEMQAGISTLVREISERRDDLYRRISALTGRHVTTVAVTKGHPFGIAVAAMQAGFADLGENYAQELIAKSKRFSELGLEEPVWHFVGRLQSNKVRQLAGVVGVWQSLDRSSVIREVAKRAGGARVLIQVDLADLEGRGGCRPEDAPALVGEALDAGLEVEGLMGVGPPGDPEDARSSFAWLASEAHSLGLPEVSMGMSGDLEVAIEEGASLLRIGTALVGPRGTRQ